MKPLELKPYTIDTKNDEEMSDWIESFQAVLSIHGKDRAKEILKHLADHASKYGIETSLVTPYINTINHLNELPYPGNLEIEEKITQWIRWNALCMVLRANRFDSSLGGHLATYASSAILYEVGFEHFFKGQNHPEGRDFVYFQGHAAPGIYARAYLEGFLNEHQLAHFRQEKMGGLPSYPHPWSMPNFWEFPTVSMGLGPLCAIYHARFLKYLENRGLKPKNQSKVWAFLGDGEMDEPESLGAITLASREGLDNLIFVVNCNLQRLDGPVRGNGKIIQELEGVFKGAGWRVIKNIWGSKWNRLFDMDQKGHLATRLTQINDGQYQKLSISSADQKRQVITNGVEELSYILDQFTDDQIMELERAGHDPVKVFNAYHTACVNQSLPTVILSKSIKGYGLGRKIEATNATHQRKKLDVEELFLFRDRFKLNIQDQDVQNATFIKPSMDEPEMIYLHQRRETLGGFIPRRSQVYVNFNPLPHQLFKPFFESTQDRELSTTMVFVNILNQLLKDPETSKWIVPIVPDEARTFGMEALFHQIGIYSPVGQLYEPVDKSSVMYYKESKQGQLLEEGINEAGAISSFIAAGSAYSTIKLNTIPFYIFYSMFGMQRVGDLVWALADAQAKGFLIGATAGKTTLAGEGLQHQDGHSHLHALSVPNLKAYDPAFAYELATIISYGLNEMYALNKPYVYYITVYNENISHPAMPSFVSQEDIISGMYLLKESHKGNADFCVRLLGSGSTMHNVLEAQNILENEFNIKSEVYSVTSYKELYKNAIETQRQNRLHLQNKECLIEKKLKGKPGVTLAVTDYVKAIPLSIASFSPLDFVALGTDGFGLSDTRAQLREHFEINTNHICFTALWALFKQGLVSKTLMEKAKDRFNIKPREAKLYGFL